MAILPIRSIKSLYPLALAEGEGIGTAYEYFAKRLALTRLLTKLPAPRSVLIAGLPEKYGCSLDFLLLAKELNVAKVVVVDDRDAALEKMRQAFARVQGIGDLADMQLHYVQVADFTQLRELADTFDLCICSEVLQRLEAHARQRYVERLSQLAPVLALFAPNGDNPAHTKISGLSGIGVRELCTLIQPIASLVKADYVDMPPFPPGLVRSAEQRERAAAGSLEALAMGGLCYYALLESWFPPAWRRSHSHIVYAFAERRATPQASIRA